MRVVNKKTKYGGDILQILSTLCPTSHYELQIQTNNNHMDHNK